MAVIPRGLGAYRSQPASPKSLSILITRADMKEQSGLSLESYVRPRMTEDPAPERLQDIDEWKGQLV